MTSPHPFDEHQRELIVTLVEAARRGKLRPGFSYLQQPPGAAPRFEHPGLRGALSMSIGDIEELEAAGLLTHQSITAGVGSFELTTGAFSTFDQLKLEAESAAARVEHALHSYLEAPLFRERYAGAYDAWAHASRLLWSDEPQIHYSTIGHLCREAAQQFAAVLSGAPADAASDADRPKTVARIRARLGDIQSASTRAFCDALLAYWGTVSDLAQRQEHAGNKEGESLAFEDARRVVFQTAIVMFEIASVLA